MSKFSAPHVVRQCGGKNVIGAEDCKFKGPLELVEQHIQLKHARVEEEPRFLNINLVCSFCGTKHVGWCIPYQTIDACLNLQADVLLLQREMAEMKDMMTELLNIVKHGPGSATFAAAQQDFNERRDL